MPTPKPWTTRNPSSTPPASSPHRTRDLPGRALRVQPRRARQNGRFNQSWRHGNPPKIQRTLRLASSTLASYGGGELRMEVTEIHIDTRRDREILVPRHFLTLIPGHRISHKLRQILHLQREELRNSIRVVARDPNQHREPGRPLHQRRDLRRVRLPDDQVPSQKPGTARSSASAARSLMFTMSWILSPYCTRRETC